MWTMRTIPVLKSGHHHSKNLDVVSGFQNGTMPYVVAMLKHGTTSMVSARDPTQRPQTNPTLGWWGGTQRLVHLAHKTKLLHIRLSYYT